MLDELVDVIETLKARIDAHRDTLQANETRTRVSLIDPLLCALGWDTADPELVTLEYDVRGKKADYAFWVPNDRTRPLLVLEAKRLGESLSNHRRQMALYAFDEGILYPALTNGDQWEVYDYTEMGSREERRVLHLSITDDPAPQIALQLLLLWQANMNSGRPEPGNKPIAVVIPNSTPNPLMRRPPIISPGQGWTRLTDFSAVKGADAPQEISLDSQERMPIGSWISILMEVSEFLVRHGVLTPEACPIAGPKPRPGFCYINTVPNNPNGTPFRRHATLSNGICVYTNLSAKDILKRSIYLLEHFGQDPSQVWLKTG